MKRPAYEVKFRTNRTGQRRAAFFRTIGITGRWATGVSVKHAEKMIRTGEAIEVPEDTQ